MNPLWLSTTLISGAQVCMRRALDAHLRRIEEGNDWDRSDPTDFGSIVHEVVEIAHKYDQRGEASPDPVSIFDDVWRRHNLQNLEYYRLGVEGIGDWVDRALFDREGITIATEIPFVIDLVTREVWDLTDISYAQTKRICAKIVKRGGVPVKSMIDRVDMMDDGSLEVIDYKTNLVPFTRDEVENSTQLCLYHVAAHQLFARGDDDAKIRVMFDMFRYGRFIHEFEAWRVTLLLNYMIGVWHQIVNLDGEKPEKLNAYCSWCHLKYECDTYIDAFDSEESLLNPMAVDHDTPTAQIYDEFERLKIIEKLARDRNRDVAQVLNARVVNANESLMYDDEHEIYLQSNPRPEYPIEEVLPILVEHNAVSILKWAGSVSRPGLDSAIRSRPQLKELITPLLKVKYASPSIKKRKIAKTATKKNRRKK